MEIEEGDQKHSIHDIFGYRKILWKIANYLPSTCGCDWVIRSPEFCVYSPILTKWRLCLMPKFDQKRYCVTTYLERLEYSPFSDKVNVLWKLSYHAVNGKETMSENRQVFLTKWGIGTDIPNISAVEGKVLKDSRDFIVICHIIVYNADNPKLLEVSRDAGLKSLSQDLAVLCATGREVDTNLFADNEHTINLHKAIVCCRNNVFKNLIGNNSIVDLDFTADELEGVEKLVRFLYTGDLKYVLRIPSFAIEKAIKHFGVEELKPYYSYDELTIETKVTVSETRLEWTVSNLDRIKKRCVLGHYMKSIAYTETFRLALYPRGISGTEEHMSLQVKFSKRARLRPLCICIGLIDVRKKVQIVKCLRWTPRDSEHIIFDNFVSRSVLTNSRIMTNGSLKLLCKLQRFETIMNEPVVESGTYPVLSVNKFKHYDMLSEQIASLLESGDYSDCTVQCKVLQIRVHKMIISSRSHVLAKMFKGDKTLVCFPNVEASVLITVLRYLYSGVLKEFEPDQILKIYDAAKSMSIQTLTNTCCNILQDNIDKKNAVEVLTTAHKHKDLKLKLAAFKFFCRNVNETEMQECWKNLMNEYPCLNNEWTDFKNSHHT